MKNLLQFRTNVRKSNRQPECTLRVEWDDRMLCIWVDVTFLYAGSSIQNASEQFVSCIHLSVLNFYSSKSTDKNLELDREIQFISVIFQN